MPNTMRALTLTGLGLLASATLGTGPAQAAPDTTRNSTGVSADQRQARWGNDEIVGYYRNIWTCDRAGRIGDRFGVWEDYNCVLVRWGFRRGAWALVVDDNDWNNRWDSRWSAGHWPRNWDYRPHWPGHHRGDHYRGLN